MRIKARGIARRKRLQALSALRGPGSATKFQDGVCNQTVSSYSELDQDWPSANVDAADLDMDSLSYRSQHPEVPSVSSASQNLVHKSESGCPESVWIHAVSEEVSDVSKILPPKENYTETQLNNTPRVLLVSLRQLFRGL